jgi:uncharacterized membrane protein YhaH (DUF805 family)
LAASAGVSITNVCETLDVLWIMFVRHRGARYYELMPTGRLGLADFWKTILFVFGLVVLFLGSPFALAVVISLVWQDTWAYLYFHPWIIILTYLLACAIILPVGVVLMINLGVRRLHDLDHSGWWLTFPVMWFVIFIVPGKSEPNRYRDPVLYRMPWDAILGKSQYPPSSTN